MQCKGVEAPAFPTSSSLPGDSERGLPSVSVPKTMTSSKKPNTKDTQKQDTSDGSRVSKDLQDGDLPWVLS